MRRSRQQEKLETDDFKIYLVGGDKEIKVSEEIKNALRSGGRPVETLDNLTTAPVKTTFKNCIFTDERRKKIESDQLFIISRNAIFKISLKNGW